MIAPSHVLAFALGVAFTVAAYLAAFHSDRVRRLRVIQDNEFMIERGRELHMAVGRGGENAR